MISNNVLAVDLGGRQRDSDVLPALSSLFCAFQWHVKFSSLRAYGDQRTFRKRGAGQLEIGGGGTPKEPIPNAGLCMASPRSQHGRRHAIFFGTCHNVSVPSIPPLSYAQVYSQNIVGYVTKALTANQKVMSGAQFVEVGEASLDLASIKLENVPAEGGASIQWWNGTGYDTAAWVEKNWDSGISWWGEMDDWEVEITHTFASGEGFWIVAPPGISAAKMIQAGEVTTSTAATYDTPLAANKKFMVINPLPTELSLSDITLNNVPAEGGASIQWWNGTGYDTAAWVEKNWDSGIPWWGEMDDWEVGITHTFNVSEGFWIVTPPGVTAPQIKIANTLL